MARVSQIVESCNPGLKNIKKMEKIKKHQPDDLKHSIQNHITQNTIFAAFIATVEKS